VPHGIRKEESCSGTGSLTFIKNGELYSVLVSESTVGYQLGALWNFPLVKHSRCGCRHWVFVRDLVAAVNGNLRDGS
jgi:hypothetical protein